MKPRTLILILSIVGCLIVAVMAYLWANNLPAASDVYRSPLDNNPPRPGQPIGEPLARRVVLVLIDGLREDTSLDAEVMPFLHELRAQGAWATMHSHAPSYSTPSYGVLMTGAWPDLSGCPALNMDYEELRACSQDQLFAAAHRAGLDTALSGYYWFEKLIPQEAISAGFYTPGEDAAADREVMDAALPWLDDTRYQLVLIHLDQVDHAGHVYTARSQGWNTAASTADDHLREIASRLDLSQDTLVVFSDHGHIDQGGHGGTEAVVLTEPFVMAGAGITPGHHADMFMVDVAPTVAALLGISIPAASQGHVLVEMLALTPEQQARIEEAVAAQQAELARAFEASTGLTMTISPDEAEQDSVAATQHALEAARPAGRAPRFVVAGVVVAAIIAVIWLRRSPTTLWLLGGAVLYLVLFNLGYLTVWGMTYSFSSVKSGLALMILAFSTAAVALIVSWLAVSLGLKLFGGASALEMAEATLGLAGMTLAFLALPILWHYAFNGLRSVYTLPEYSSMYLALLSLMQVLVIGITGPLLAGLGAGIVALRKRATRRKT